MRWVIPGLLLLALWDPPPPPFFSGRGGLDLFVLLDQSASMQGVDRLLWPSLRPTLAALPNGSRLALFRFAAGPVEERPIAPTGGEEAEWLRLPFPPARQPLDNTATDLEAVLNAALYASRPGRDSVLLLASDGVQTRGDAAVALKRIKAAGMGVYWVPPPSAMDRKTRLRGLYVPPRLRFGAPLPVSVWVRGPSDLGKTGYDPCPTRRDAVAVGGDAQCGLVLVVRRNGEVVGRRVLMLDQGGSASVTLSVEGAVVGANRIDVALYAAHGALLDRRAAGVSVSGPATVLYVTREPASPAAAALRAGGLRVTAVVPGEFGAGSAAPGRYAVVVLDDIAVDEVAEEGWAALQRAVRSRGVGLLVFGGPHSFGPGGYRHSRLETLLPVTAEAGQPQGRAAVLFLVDKSGSMARTVSGATRLQLAHEAVRETAGLLATQDLMGVIAFDRTPRRVLALKAYKDKTAAIDGAWRFEAGGGTRIGVALGFAAEQLVSLAPSLPVAAGTPCAPTDTGPKASAVAVDGPCASLDVLADRRILVLVSDGFIEKQAGTGIGAGLARQGIETLAFALGPGVDRETLGSLVGPEGRVLPVGQVHELPRLMRRETNRLLEPARTGSFPVRQTAPLPFSRHRGRPPPTWPDVFGYTLTRPKPGAEVYLRTSEGDPLLAMSSAGAGRVAVWPAGVGAWARDWWAWRGFGEVLGETLGWLAADADAESLDARIQPSADGPELIVDALTPAGQWASATAAEAVVTDPAGNVESSALTPLAPGRYHTLLTPQSAGVYRVVARVGDASLPLVWVHDPNTEVHPPAAAMAAPRKWMADGLLRPWPENGAAGLEPPTAVQGATSTRLWALLGAGVLFLLLLGGERLPAGRV